VIAKASESVRTFGTYAVSRAVADTELVLRVTVVVASEISSRVTPLLLPSARGEVGQHLVQIRLSCSPLHCGAGGGRPSSWLVPRGTFSAWVLTEVAAHLCCIIFSQRAGPGRGQADVEGEDRAGGSRHLQATQVSLSAN
jgi:hypothetical protein